MPWRPERNDARNRAPDTQWRPKNVNNKWKSSYKNTPRLATVNHNQFVNIPKTTVTKKVEMPPRFKQQPANNNNNDGEIKDLRQYLNSKKQVTFENSDSSSTSSASDRVPHSTKTNRSALMLSLPRKNSPPALNPIQVENLKNNSLAAVDLQSPLWDSWTSSDESGEFKSKPVLRQTSIEFTGDNIVDLYNFTHSRKLDEPSFKILPRHTKPHKPTYYDCQIKVGTHTYSSYPIDFTNEIAAKQHAAKIALDELIAKYGKRKSLLLSTEQEILDRVPPIVEKHYHGIWNWQLEANYADIFKEQLPMNWLNIIDTSPKISVEAFLDNKYVLRYCKPEDKDKKMVTGAIADVSVASNTITFNEDGTLIGVITCAVSAREIWCRQIDTKESDAYNTMMSNFSHTYAHMKSFTECVHDIMVGGFYAAYCDNNWYRVRVFEVNEEDANCFLIDFGDEQLITKDNIYQLKREFAKDQAQAFVCRLAGLENLYEVSTSPEHFLSLVGKVVHVENESEENAKNDSISVYLSDMVRNVSINEELIAIITLESASPRLNKNGIMEAYVCHAEPNGDVFVHTNSMGIAKLDSLLIELEATLPDKVLHLLAESVTPENSKNRLYLAKCKIVGHWYRVRITDFSPDGKYAQIYFVDYGKFDIITLANEALYPIDELDDILDKFPEQALQVRLMIDNIPSDFVEKVRDEFPPEQLVLLKYVETDSNNVPCVKVFKRINNCLVSIESINFEREKAVPSTNRPEKLQRLISLNQIDDLTLNKNVPSTGILKSPVLPQIGQYLDVIVPSAVNPWNFFVQPYDSNDALSKLMTDLQAAYANVLYSPLQIEDIKPGNIYASKHDDGLWYRTSVIRIIHSGSISVFYCDFGYYANLNLQQLIPLESQFLELPFQAIKAKLAGIRPKQKKWTMDDCKSFQKLVCHKSFVSILIAIEKDELYRFDTVLNLKLIDTSTDADVHVNQVLVKRGIATDAV